jgi:hypothetical protein
VIVPASGPPLPALGTFSPKLLFAQKKSSEHAAQADAQARTAPEQSKLKPHKTRSKGIKSRTRRPRKSRKAVKTPIRSSLEKAAEVIPAPKKVSTAEDARSGYWPAPPPPPDLRAARVSLLYK